MMKYIKNIIYSVKRWFYELNLEKLLLLVSLLVFYLITLTLQTPDINSSQASVKPGKTLGDYKKVFKDFIGLPEEVKISRQTIRNIKLLDPQSIFLKNIKAENSEDLDYLERNPFYDDNSQEKILDLNANKVVNPKEGMIFVGIISSGVKINSDLSVILKGSVSGEYKTLKEGDRWDGITVISVTSNIVKIRNRVGEIREYTTRPDVSAIK